MGKNSESEKIKRTLKLEANLTVYEAASLKEMLAGALAAADILEVDMTDVKECDTSGLQVLCSMKKTADQKIKKIVLLMIPHAVQDAMNRTGITHQMMAHDGGTGCQK